MQITPMDEASHRPPVRAPAELQGADANPTASASTGAQGAGELQNGKDGKEQAKDGTVPPSFVNPVIRFDPSAGLAVLQFRDSDTGEPRFQVPSQRAVMEYREQMASMRAAPSGKGESA